MAEDYYQAPVDTGNTGGKKIRYNKLAGGSGDVYALGTFLTDPNTFANIQAITAKGVQGSFGAAVQDLKDAGRSAISLNWEEVAGTAAVESALTNFTSGSRGGTALGAASSLTVTAGKTLRIVSVAYYVKATSTVNNIARFRIRHAATVANTSPIVFDRVLAIELGTVAAGALCSQEASIPDGIEIAAGQQVTFTWFTAANTCTVGMNIVGFEY